MEQITKIAGFIFDSLVHIWPYLLISIPLSVAVQLSGAAKFINQALSKKPLISILLATVVGAFSPFCSCGVIPVIASLLIGGVPLAPVMSFWIASPSMDPEIFFLSVATIGFKLSVWRLAATFAISLTAGFLTHFATKHGLLDKNVLKEKKSVQNKFSWKAIKINIAKTLKLNTFTESNNAVQFQMIAVEVPPKQKQRKPYLTSKQATCCNSQKTINAEIECTTNENSCSGCKSAQKIEAPFYIRLRNETWKASMLVIKFMSLAFLINAILQIYLPQNYVSNLLGNHNSFSVLIASLIGVPAYTTNVTALPLISGLLSLGMNQGAALAFLIAGPTTTLPAMAAVYGIVKKKIFFLYVAFSFIGAIVTGMLYNFFMLYN